MTLLVSIFLMATAAHASARPVAPERAGACGLLTRADLSAVQGEPYSDAKLTSRGETAQCFYQLPTFTKSVSLDVSRTGGKEFWRDHFEHPGEREEEVEEGRAHAVRVSGVGDEAYWDASKVSGSLYVRKGDALLRISVGGAGSDAEKMARSKRLAQKALRRL